MILFTAAWCVQCRNVKKTLDAKCCVYKTVDVEGRCKWLLKSL